MKSCTVCNLNLDIDNFRVRKNRSVHSWCLSCEAAHKRQYYLANRTKIISQNKDYYEENKSSRRKTKNAYHKLKMSTDPIYKIRHRLRIRVYNIMNNGPKTGSPIKYLGCSKEFLKTYLESKFQPGMNWDNHGIDGWHVDHIKPLISFDLTNIEEFKQACHYTNLQPLWAEDNWKKNKKT